MEKRVLEKDENIYLGGQKARVPLEEDTIGRG
jgi:hypothetical protein